MASSTAFSLPLKSDSRSSENTLSSTGSWIETHDPFRMGTAKLLPLPLRNSPVSGNEPMIRVWENIRPEILRLLEKRKMNFSTLKLVHRQLPGMQPPKALTILVSSIAEANDKWVLFIDDLLSLLLNVGITDWGIEVIDPRIGKGKATIPISGSDPIVELWSDLRDKVLTEIGERDWTSLQVCKMGYDIEGIEKRVTVILTVRNMFDEIWIPVVRGINDILGEYPYCNVSIDVQLLQGRTCLYAGSQTSLSINDFTTAVAIGASLGPNPKTGTLGAYLSLKSESKEYTTCGLTNYHVVDTPSMTSDDTKHGISDAQDRQISIHSPSRMDVERSFKAQQSLAEVYQAPIERLNERIGRGIYNDENELNKLEKNLDRLRRSRSQCLEDAQQMEEFDSLFGVVKAGSGLRKGRDSFSLDWALIDIKHGRIGDIANQVPDFDKYPQEAEWDPIGVDLRLENICTSALTPSTPPQAVFKKGRTTGYTWGLASAIRTAVKLEEEIYTVVDICSPESYPHDFCKHGDSGAIVLDKRGQLCGLLIGGTERDFGQGSDLEHGFVIPIDIIFDDIEKLTGLKVSLP